MQAQHAATPATTIARNIKAEMAAFMMDRDGVTREDLLQRFTPAQVDKYGAAAAREATRNAERRYS